MIRSSAMIPFLAHSHAEALTFWELFWSVGLLILSGALAAVLFLTLFLRPILARWKQGRLSSFKKWLYLTASAVVVLCFLVALGQFGWAIYLDRKYEQFEQAQKAANRHLEGGGEYKWNRWHIYGRYEPPNLCFYIDDVLGRLEPRKEITVSIRRITPTLADWTALSWDEKKKAFIGSIKPEGNAMDFDFDVKSGWDHYTDQISAFVPRQAAAPAKPGTEPTEPPARKK